MDDLRALAEAATPGPWEVHDDGVWAWWTTDSGIETLRLIAEPDEDVEANRAYIAALSPDVTLALLDELETLRAALPGLLATHGDPCRLGDDCPAVTMARGALAGSGR